MSVKGQIEAKWLIDCEWLIDTLDSLSLFLL